MQLPWNIPEFNRSHISSYLVRYELLAEECHLDSAAKVRRFTFYYANKVILQVKCLSGYSERNWTTFAESLKEFYFSKDPEQMEYQESHLITLAYNHRRGLDHWDIIGYSMEFRRVAQTLPYLTLTRRITGIWRIPA